MSAKSKAPTMTSLTPPTHSILAGAQPAFLAALTALVLGGCGGDDSAVTLPRPAATVVVPTATAPAPSVVPARRTLVEGHLGVTRAQNLLLDPGFSLTAQGETGAGTFIAFYESGSGEYQVPIRVDSASPAGFAGGVATLKEPRATDARSRSLQLIASFTGGKGPFEARVWVSSIDAAGAPRPFPEDEGGFKASLVDAAQENAADLRLDPEKKLVVGNRTWVLYTGQLKKDLVGGGLMAITTGTSGGGFEAAAPEIVAIPTLATALSRGRPLSTRPLTPGERRVIGAYAAIPPRLVPAAKGIPVQRPGVRLKAR